MTGNGRDQTSKRLLEKTLVALAACVRFLDLPAHGVTIHIELRTNFLFSVHHHLAKTNQYVIADHALDRADLVAESIHVSRPG